MQEHHNHRCSRQQLQHRRHASAQHAEQSRHLAAMQQLHFLAAVRIHRQREPCRNAWQHDSVLGTAGQQGGLAGRSWLEAGMPTCPPSTVADQGHTAQHPLSEPTGRSADPVDECYLQGELTGAALACKKYSWEHRADNVARHVHLLAARTLLCI